MLKTPLSSCVTSSKSLNFSKPQIFIYQRWIRYLTQLDVKLLHDWHRFPEVERAKAGSWNLVDNLNLCTNSQLALRNSIRKIKACSKMTRNTP